MADTNPPTVAAVTPTDQATNVAASVTPTARFAADVTPGSVVMTLQTAAGATVNGSSSYDPATRTVTFTPAAALANYTQYRATVTAQNTSGVAMPSPKVWTFTTADTIAPTVSSISPGNNATGVSANTTVSATFARAIDPASLQMLSLIHI